MIETFDKENPPLEEKEAQKDSTQVETALFFGDYADGVASLVIAKLHAIVLDVYCFQCSRHSQQGGVRPVSGEFGKNVLQSLASRTSVLLSLKADPKQS